MLCLVMIVTAFASTSNVLAFPLVSPGVKYEFYCRLIIILKTLLPDRLLRVSVEDMLFRLTHWLQRLLVSQSNAYTTFWLMLWLLTVIVSWLYWNNSIQVVWNNVYTCITSSYDFLHTFHTFRINHCWIGIAATICYQRSRFGFNIKHKLLAYGLLFMMSWSWILQVFSYCRENWVCLCPCEGDSSACIGGFASDLSLVIFWRFDWSVLGTPTHGWI